MNYREIYGDLFKVDSKYYLCHCISSDFALGKGIAVEFDKRFNMRSKLWSVKKEKGLNWPCAVLIDNVFNLVTKEKYWMKPTYKTLKEALFDMKSQIVQKNIKYLAMPQIGSGLDKLAWELVSNMIKEIFKDVEVEILVVKWG